MNNILPVYFAPVQGHTDHAYRSMHASVYGSAQKYYTPFIRVEKGALRRRDVADFKASSEEGLPVVPQVIFRDYDELKLLIDSLAQLGASEIDLNMGCPFPLQTARGRGAAAIGNASLSEVTAEVIACYPELQFSLKMRLGMNEADEWRVSADVINSMKLIHLTVHPRVARQQYKGETDMEEFAYIMKVIRHPLIYNGDLRVPDDVRRIHDQFPSIYGVMCGRGLLGRPSLAMEIAKGKDMPADERLQMMLDFHSRLFSYYEDSLHGDAQILSKIAPFWEYAESEIGRKSWKSIKKASTIPKYLTAIAQIQQSAC